MKFGPKRNSNLMNHKYIWNCGPWHEIKNLDRFAPEIAMCSNFYEIWHLGQ